GVQSIAPADLVALGRDHRMGEGLSAIDAVAAAGFARYSANLILGAPRRGGGARPGEGDPLAGAARLADRGVPHLSIYELTVEEGTPLSRQVARGEVEIGRAHV